ncbi:hypothetical protein [Clostridium sp. B9]|uniref:hypothetical protein n=1 Tax=Clostridium sp. B9 TaxID=3423224 RepID=UPI003D2EE9EF
MKYLGYAIIVLSPVLGPFFGGLYDYLIARFLPFMLTSETPLVVVFATLGLILVLKDDGKKKEEDNLAEY